MKMLHRSAVLLLCGAALVAPALHGAETATARENNVNVRGQPSLTGEVITRLKQGEAVTVLDEIFLLKPKTGEPAKWAKIAMPANTPVWVATVFLDASNKTVMPKRLNLRAGPGENFSVVGRLEHGVAVKPISVKEDWTEIEQPPGTYAYVAADLLNRPTTPPPEEKPTTATPPPEPKASTPPVLVAALPARAATNSPPPEAPAPAAPAVANSTEPKTTAAIPVVPVILPPAATPSPAVVAAVVAPTVTERPAPIRASEITPVAPPPVPRKRIVRREGFVSDTVSIQAPTPLGLDSLATRAVIDFLQPTTTNTVLKKFKGQRVVVTGEEGIDRRWRKVPVLYVQTIELLPE
ncbi:MAG: SH3 domain-containing protein [Verrucomicrobia bacterium]|nr:SH3 domain-containing protein [Verrucomicrobiota bacterium]